MSIATLNISLPQSLKDFVEEQAEGGAYGTPSEYVGELLRQDQIRTAKQKLEALLLEGLDSGEPIEATPEYWENKRRRLIERHAGRTAR